MSEQKENKGMFKPGKSGNPAGRPKGSKNQTTMIKQAIEGQLVEQLADDAQAILGKAIEKAKDGDPQMIKLVLDKLMPNAKGDGIQLERGSGGINIVVQGYEKEPSISAERVIDNDEEDNG